MRKLFRIVIVAIVLTSTAYSQQVKSSFFSIDQLEDYRKNIIRAYTPGNMLVVSSYSEEEQRTKIAFLKENSNVVKYIELPYGCTVTDFVILDDCIYFCGKNNNINCCYIGMSVISTSLQGASGYSYFNTDSVSAFKKLVAYKEQGQSAIGIAAIGIPQNTAYTSCVIDVNNFNSSNQSWKYYYGSIAGEEITDICDASPDLLVTVGKQKVSSSGNSGIIALSPDLYLRGYKKENVLSIGNVMGDLQYKYNNCIVPNTTGGGFLVEPVDSYNIAVVGVSSENKFLSKIYPITISKIDINAFEMNNTQRITFDSTHCRNLVDLEYFPTVNKLGVLTNLSDNTRGELLFVDMAKTSAYTSSRLWRANNLFNSITESNNGNFEILCSSVLMFAYNAHVLLENLNIYKNSQCSSNQNIYVSSSSISKEPTRQDKPFNKYERNVNWSYVSTELHETSVTIYCANYYK